METSKVKLLSGSKQRSLNSKVVQILDICGNASENRLITTNACDPIRNILSDALMVSSKNTKHYSETLMLIKQVNPGWFDSVFEELPPGSVSQKSDVEFLGQVYRERSEYL